MPLLLARNIATQGPLRPLDTLSQVAAVRVRPAEVVLVQPQIGRELAELQKVHEATSAEVSALQDKLQAAAAEVEQFRVAAEELKALAARRAEMSPRETQTSPPIKHEKAREKYKFTKNTRNLER